MSENIKPGVRVGKVTDIDGKLLTFTRKYPSGTGTFQCYVGMPVYLGDILETGKNTQAALEFDIGGQAGISPATKIQIVGLRDIEEIGNQFIVKSGKMWAKIDRQKSQLQIQTSGGVIGIEG